MARSVVPPSPDERLGLSPWPSSPRVAEIGGPSMVSQTCLIGFTVGGLAVGMLLGMLWSSRQGHGEHAAYDPAFSAAAVIDRVRATQDAPADDDQADAEPAPPAPDLSDEPAPVDVVDAPLYGRHPDDPALFRYHFSAADAPVATSNELTTPLPRLPSQAANRRALPPTPQRPENRRSRHALRPPAE